MNDLYGDLYEKKKKRKKAGTESSKESSLRDWFGRKGAKGKRKGWVDCNAPDGKGGYKSCGRGSGEKRKKYPACRPTPGACKERGKGKSWGKKAKKRKNEELYMDLDKIIREELKAYLLESHSKEHEEELGEIVKELEKASQMHASQAERIQKILDETDDDELKEGKKNCGCGQDPCKTYGIQENVDEETLDEKRKKKKKKKKKSGKKDACYHKVKSRYKVWPSAYASGALVKCRKVGAKNWGNSKKEQLQAMVEDELTQVLHEKQLYEGFIDSIMSKFRSEPEVEVEPEQEEEEKEEKPKRKPFDSDHPDHPDHPDNIRARQRARQSKKDSDAYYGRTVSDIYGKNYSNRRPKSRFYQYTTEGAVPKSLEDIIYYTLLEVLEEKKKKPCKPSKGKRFAKRVNGKCRSYGQAGKAKGGGDRIRPGTKKGDAYCARSAKIKKCKNPPCANDLSRKKWKCRGSKSMKE